ncbi:MAG: magnesium/cobalt transporter CorA [Ignavibacteria bacterium]|nr:magnesium/cobalt transporter CorA [Ignavibacteria bacterium]
METKKNEGTKRPGSAPGSLIFMGEKKVDKVRIRTFRWNADQCEEQEYNDVGDLPDSIGKKDTWWINIDGLHDPALLARVGERFGIHSLVLEDILNTRQRPKVDDYDEYLFAVLKMLEFDSSTKKVIQEQLSLILLPNVVLSFQERTGVVFDILRERIRSQESRIRRKKSDYFFYRIIDTIVDRYFRTLEEFGEMQEDLEEEVMEKPNRNLLRQIQEQKRQMVFLRRAVWPVREMVSTLLREETKLVTDSTRTYLRDVHDHTIQVLDTIEGFRDTVAGMLDIYLSSASNRMNEVMKTLTIMASIFIPLTFVAGIYGMNFNPESSPFNMPELNWVLGYPFVLGLMGGIAAVMVIYFRKKDWI